MVVIQQLVDLGFTEYEARVYTALVVGNKLSAREIYNLADVPKGRVYSILASLMDMGMCVMIPGSVQKYQALPPEDAFSALYDIKRMEHEAEAKKARKLSKYLNLMYEDDESSGTEFDSVSIFTAGSTITNKVRQMVDKTNYLHRSLSKPPYISIPSLEDLEEKSEGQLQAMKRGVEFRSIYELEAHDMETFNHICNYFHKHGEKVRIMEKLPIKMAISDSSLALFTMHHKSLKRNKFASMFIENADLILALTDLFDYYWSIATDYPDFVKNGYKLNPSSMATPK